MNDFEKKVIEEAEYKGANHVHKHAPNKYSRQGLYYELRFCDRQHYIVYYFDVTWDNYHDYEMFNSLEYKKEHLIKDLKAGGLEEKLDI